MTTAEKLALLSNGSAGVARLGIPALRGIDGPNGIGEGNTRVTAFPDAETIAASWDPAVARAYGQALGAEAAGKGFDWLFAPTINIVRTPLWGREAETLGEDPFLTAPSVAPEIRGIQSQHVISQVKHYAGNNQEVDRFGQPLGSDAVSDQVSERALQEIYLPGFRAAVQQGHVGSVMCSYNRINGAPLLPGPADAGHAEELRAAGVRRARCRAGRPRRCRRGQRRRRQLPAGQPGRGHRRQRAGDHHRRLQQRPDRPQRG